VAAQVFLVGSETDDPNARYDGAGPIVAVSTYVLPVFWCGAFATDDMRARHRSGTNAGAGMGAASYPVLLTALAEAKKRAVWRRPLVFEYLPASLEQVCDEWLALLDSIDAPHILVDTLELAGLLAPRRVRPTVVQLRTRVRAGPPRRLGRVARSGRDQPGVRCPRCLVRRRRSCCHRAASARRPVGAPCSVSISARPTLSRASRSCNGSLH